nr:ribosomal protein L32 [Clematis petriei]UTD47624.1 ribosomal protein L32 [Clematis petriei]
MAVKKKRISMSKKHIRNNFLKNILGRNKSFFFSKIPFDREF